MERLLRSATFKLTLWYQAIVMTICLIFSIAVYHFATNELTMGLHHQTQRIFQDFPVFQGNPLLRPGRDVDAGSHHILWQLIYFNVLVLILSSIACYFLARRTLRPIEVAHKQQKRFTADVSHELRTPLTSLTMNSEVTLMDKQIDKAGLRAALESNLEDAAIMSSLINNLLKLTKLDADQTTANFSDQSLAIIIDNARQQVQRAAAAKYITIHADEITDTPVQGEADSLTQLLVILLDNAIKYSPDKATVYIASSVTPNTVSLIVRDEGQGIPPEALPHVFDRFYRSDGARAKANGEGFGLGLSIAKLIADRHHAELILKSRVGQGTTATVIFPRPT